MTANLENIVRESIAGMKFECLSVEHLSGGLLRIVIDRSSDHPESGDGVTIDDCEICSRHLQYVFSVENVEYRRLEVSSPGLDRPLRKLADFERFIGFPVRIQTKLPIERYSGRKNFRGRLTDAQDERIIVKSTGAEFNEQLGGSCEFKSLKLSGKSKQHKVEQETFLSTATFELMIYEIRSACLIPQIDFRKRKT